MDPLLFAKLLVFLQLFLSAPFKSFGFLVYVSERVPILLAFLVRPGLPTILRGRKEQLTPIEVRIEISDVIPV